MVAVSSIVAIVIIIVATSLVEWAIASASASDVEDTIYDVTEFFFNLLITLYLSSSALGIGTMIIPF